VTARSSTGRQLQVGAYVTNVTTVKETNGGCTKGIAYYALLRSDYYVIRLRDASCARSGMPGVQCKVRAIVINAVFFPVECDISVRVNEGYRK